MGCFAKGCLAVVCVLVALGIIAGIGVWYVYSQVRPFVTTAPSVVRTFPATAEQYEELQTRIAAFQTTLTNDHRATLELSADDLNVCVARSPSYEQARGKVFLGIADNQLVIDASFPVSDKNRQTGGTETVYYLNGRMYCDLSYVGGEFVIVVRKIEPLDGQSTSAFMAAMVANPGFSRSLNRAFNESFRSSLHRNPAGEAFMEEVRSITVRDNRVVITAGDQ